MEVSSADKFDSAFKEAIKAGSAAIAMTAKPVTMSNQKQIVDLATKNRLPAIYPRGDFVASGGLMSYGADRRALQTRRRSCRQDPKGAKPADLPVEQPTKFEFVNQSENRQADRADDSAKRADAGGQGDQVRRGE